MEYIYETSCLLLYTTNMSCVRINLTTVEPPMVATLSEVTTFSKVDSVVKFELIILNMDQCFIFRE